jgi:DNA-binding PucR family transcriptional regulator
MFAHRNTINYRINKFISLTSINVREMQNAVLVYFIITLMDINE